MKKWYHLLAILPLLIAVCSCSEAPKDKEDSSKGTGLFTESSDNPNGIASGMSGFNAGAFNQEPEGPQYQQPNMDVLKGKPQLFPSRYPIKRYPGAKVTMVDVRPNRPPGYKNLVMMATADPSKRISGFYQHQMIGEQWKKVSEYRNDIYECSRWVKGDLEAEVRIMPDLVASNSDKKYVQILYGLKGKKIAPPKM